MTEVKRRRRGFRYEQKWFARRTSARDVFRLVAYFQFLGRRPPLLFIRRSFRTLLIDLGRDPQAILGAMHKNVRAEIRRADTEGITWTTDVELEEFASYHEAFAREKGIEGVDCARLLSFGAALLLSRATQSGRTLVQHAYIVDHTESRARFLYSSSGRFEGANSALVGRANRWCHWRDMLFLREYGIRTYDLGGIASSAGAEKELAGIDEFKIRFGGSPVREDHWLSPLYFVGLLAGFR
jgi:hypothetical protein